MKRKTKLILCVIATISAIFCLFACGDTVKPSDVHNHNYQWVDNGDGTHKQHCSESGCDNPDKNAGSHKFEKGVCVCGAVEEKKHSHTYDKKETDEKYLKSAATCTEKAKYYYSCTCGEKGTETFEYGELEEHTFTVYVQR